MTKHCAIKWHIIALTAVFLLTGAGLLCPEFSADTGEKLLYFTAGYRKPAVCIIPYRQPDRLHDPVTYITAYLPVAELGGTGETMAILPGNGFAAHTDEQSVCTIADNHTGFVSSNKKVFYLLI